MEKKNDNNNVTFKKEEERIENVENKIIYFYLKIN